MRYASIDDIFSANEMIRSQLVELLSDVSHEEAARRPAEGEWSIQEIVEHIAMVAAGTAKICAKLVDGARRDGVPADGSFSLSDEFTRRSEAAAAVKITAPERVQPTGNVSISASLAMLTEAESSVANLGGEMRSLDLRGHKFAHPFFGDLTAAEWLVVAGGHERRHTQQVQRILRKFRE